MHQAGDVMTRPMITMSPATIVTDAINVLLQNKISGAPVVDDDGKLIGLISETDLLCIVIDESMAHTPIGELMSRELITVDENTTLIDVAQAFLSLRLRRMPVLNNGALVGQVSRRDVLRAAVDDENAVRMRQAEAVATA